MFRIDPVAPLVWRSTTALQIGVDPPLAVLDPVPLELERLVAALVTGADRAELDSLAEARCLPAGEVDRLLATVAPALQPDAPPPPAPVLLEGPEELTAELAVVPDLQRTSPGAPLPAARPALVVLLARHVLPPGRAARWLGVDVPHLPVVFCERAAVLGPLVLPGASPCLRCAEEHRLDGDPAWPAIAAQLMRLPAAASAAVPALRLEVGARLAAVLREVRGGVPPSLAGTALRLGEDGSVSRLERPWHERCSCRSLQRAAGPRGTVTGTAPPTAVPPSTPTRA